MNSLLLILFLGTSLVLAEAAFADKEDPPIPTLRPTGPRNVRKLLEFPKTKLT